MADFSPMMKQYFNLKREHPNTILFFRLGDFYEMFFNDAKTVSQELDLTLTGRDCGQGERAPMCGIPYHSSEGYISKLLAKVFTTEYRRRRACSAFSSSVRPSFWDLWYSALIRAILSSMFMILVPSLPFPYD